MYIWQHRRKAGSTTRKKTKPEYKMVKSIESDSLNYVTARMGDIVSKEMADGWLPHGTPMTLIEDGKYILVQAMVKESEETRLPLLEISATLFRIAKSLHLDQFFGSDISEMVPPSFVNNDLLVEMFVGGKTLYRMVPTDIMRSRFQKLIEVGSNSIPRDPHRDMDIPLGSLEKSSRETTKISLS